MISHGCLHVARIAHEAGLGRDVVNIRPCPWFSTNHRRPLCAKPSNSTSSVVKFHAVLAHKGALQPINTPETAQWALKLGVALAHFPVHSASVAACFLGLAQVAF